jgi:hypothetical protein
MRDVLTYGSTAGELAAQGKIFGVEAATGKKLWAIKPLTPFVQPISGIAAIREGLPDADQMPPG